MLASREFQNIVDDFSTHVYNHALRMLGNCLDAEEAVFDVFLRVHQGLPHFRQEAQLSTWIWKITTNICLSRRAKKVLPVVSLENNQVMDTESLPLEHATPETLLIQQEERQILADLIARLPDGEASAITLFYLEGMDYNEIAMILEIPVGTVGTALHRGRERLRTMVMKRKVMV
ncbi:MAG: sigma-70 family RNA polymerase sigma factor [bacterium]